MAVTTHYERPLEALDLPAEIDPTLRCVALLPLGAAQESSAELGTSK
jgi:hypothetical protein